MERQSDISKFPEEDEFAIDAEFIDINWTEESSILDSVSNAPILPASNINLMKIDYAEVFSKLHLFRIGSPEITDAEVHCGENDRLFINLRTNNLHASAKQLFVDTDLWADYDAPNEHLGLDQMLKKLIGKLNNLRYGIS